MTTLGIDVSHHQGVIDWQLVSASAFRFAYIKASEGSTWEDARFQTNWAGARDAGLLHGAYHFAQPSGDPETQAAHFAAVVGPSAWGELPPALDLELSNGLQPEAVVEWVLAFVKKAETLFGRQLIIYTGSFWRGELKNPTVPALGERWLWTARYASAPPVVPSSWTRWDFWQFSDGTHGEVMKVPGVSGPCDLDRFRGELDELEVLAAAPSAPLQPPNTSPEPGVWNGQFLVWPHVPVIRGDQVRAWQSRMQARGYHVVADGAYGPESKRACLALQRDAGIPPDGIVGPKTWAATFAAESPP